MRSPLKIHCLQHHQTESPALIAEWANSQNFSLSVTKLHDGASFPQPDDFDLLVVLGGQMGSYEASQYPWLKEEKHFLKQTISLNKKVIGIGLGAQLIAEVLGGTVTRGPFWEVGWHEVEWTELAKEHPFFKGFPPRFRAFQWHHDTFTLPQGALQTATATAYPTQGFLIDNHIAGFQFHPEVTEELLLEWVGSHHCELPKETFVQRIDEILHQADRLDRAKSFLFTFLDRFTQA